MKVFTVATPVDFDPVIEYILHILKSESSTSSFASPTNPTPPSAKDEVDDGAAIITLTGDLGAGKTTFTQQLAGKLGVTEPVVSPTFGIMKSYELVDNEYFDQLIHIDAYRIEDINEAGPLRLQELFVTPRTLVCLEWPEQIAAILPAQTIAVSIEITEGEVREVQVA